MMNHFKRLLRWLTPRAARDFGKMVTPTQEGGFISDGIDYSLPMPLPGRILALDAEETREQYLHEVDQFTAAQTFRFQFDTPQRSAKDLPYLPTPTDPLKEDNWQQRRAKLANFHSTFLYNPMANSALRYYADMVLGQTGFNLKCKNKDVEEILEGFICNPDNMIREREREFMTALPLDGELFLRYFEQGGETVMIPLRPWDCEYIDTDPDFFKRVNYYQFQFLKQAGDNPTRAPEYERKKILADEIQHIAINHLPYELRGRSMLEPVMPWLRAYKEFLENRARQNHWRTALLWLVQVANASGSQITGILQRWSKPPSPGTVAVESANTSVTPLVNPSSAAEANEDGRQIKLMILSCFHLPEYFFADGYNANLASATAQELPALAVFESFQTLLIEQIWTPMFKRVLQNAIDAGLLPEEVEEQDADGDTLYEDPPMDDMPMPAVPMNMPTNGNGATAQPPMPPIPMMQPPKQGKAKTVETLEAFDVSYAPVRNEDTLPLTQALAIHEDREWVDKQTIQDKLGYDSAIVDKRLASDKQETLKAQAAGTEPLSPDQLMQMDRLAPKGLEKQPLPQQQSGVG